MNSIDPRQVAFGTITYFPKWYRGRLQSIKHTDKVRGDLALIFFRKGVPQGFQVIAIDGKSSKTFQKELAGIPGLKVVKRKSEKRSPNKRLAIQIASKIPGVKVIVLTEAEKVSLLEDCITQIVTPLLQDKADIVIPRRNPALFKSEYPRYMYDSEMEADSLYDEALRAHGFLGPKDEQLDLFFGPRAFQNKKSVIQLFMKQYDFSLANLSLPQEYFDTENYSNTMYFPIVAALKKKLRVLGVEVPFVYPKNQKENEEKGVRELFLEKRKSQKLSILVELLHFLSYLDKKEFSRVKPA